MILNLDTTALPLVTDILAAPPENGKYDMIKARLIGSLDETNESKLRKLLRGHEIGDEKPSTYLQRLRNLSGGQCNDSVLRTLFMEQLPENIRTVLAISEMTDLSKLAAQADKVADIVKPSIAAVAPVGSQTSASSSSDEKVEELTKMVNLLVKEVKKCRFRSRSRPRYDRYRARSQSRGKDTDGNDLCYYHNKFGDKSWKCRKPCSWKKPADETGN